MFTSLDLLIVVVMALAAAGLLALTLMFLVKSRKVRLACLYTVAGLGLYMGYVGIRINGLGFLPQAVLAGALALAGIGSLVLAHLGKGNEQKFLAARILASASLVAGMINAFC